MKRRLSVLILCLISFTQAYSTNSLPYKSTIILGDSAKISLLTCSQSVEQVYAMFGHTAIRVQDADNNLNTVFNYGLFNFNTPNFLYLFISGQTDYMVGATDYDNFLMDYGSRGLGVEEQVLNLNQTEKQKLLDALITNALPENRIYRYDFFYDNCATRPRDMIEKYIDGRITYSPSNKSQTYRDLVHECVSIRPWVRFGIDLLIGSDADKKITDRQKDFLPFYLENAYTGATIKNSDGTQRILMDKKLIILNHIEIDRTNTANYPLLMGCLLFSIILIISIISHKERWFIVENLIDTLLFILFGLAGCIIFFLMFFSEHPCTYPNWNIVWLNPIQLGVGFLFFVKIATKGIYYYHFINFVALGVFLLAWYFIPQQLEIAFIPYILTICLRSGIHILKQKLLKNQATK